MASVLQRLSATFNRSTARIYHDAEKRAAVAIIMRVVGQPPAAYIIPRAMTFLQTPAAGASTVDNTEVLYIKRSASPTDPWSGNVAFPGGRREPGESDYDAAVRETWEEVGLRLASQPTDAAPFLYLGRLDDRHVYARGKRRDMALCPFVFVQTVPSDDPRAPAPLLNPSEVAAYRWIPLCHLSERRVDPYGVTLPFRLVPAIAAIPEPLRAVIGLDRVHHPSILLQDRKQQMTGPGSIATQVLAEMLVSDARPSERAAATGVPLRAEEAASAAHEKFQLWGLTLQATSDLLAAAGLRRINWPPIRFNGAVVNSLVYAICGGLEVMEVLRSERALRDVNTPHIAWFCAFLATAPLAAYALMRGGGELWSMLPRL